MLINTFKKTAAVALAIALMAAAGCKKDSGDDDDDEDEGTTTVNGGSGSTEPGGAGTLPQVGAINLETLGTGEEGAALALQDGNKCGQEGLGMFGLALGGACHTAPFAAKLMIGNDSGDHDGDGDMDCDDLAAAKAGNTDAGMLLHLMCEQVMLDNDSVTSLAGNDNGVFAISFADFANDTTAVGSWTQGNAASYPADIRAWKGEGFDSVKGIFALGLTDVNNGKVDVDFSENGQLQASIQYANRTDTSACVTGPSNDTCHWQDIKLYGGEGGETNGPPNGFHLKIFADSKTAPTFIALEGKYRYTEAGALTAFGGHTGPCAAAVESIRHVYFNTAQKGGQIWGTFQFRDENDDLISCNIPGVGDIFSIISAGVCQNLGDDEPVDCTDVNGADYATLWQGESAFEDITASPVGGIWDTGAPTSAGLCTTSGCQAF